MKSYLLEIGCPRCGSDVEHVNGVNRGTGEACAVVWCPKCRVEFDVQVRLTAVIDNGRIARQQPTGPRHHRALTDTNGFVVAR